MSDPMLHAVLNMPPNLWDDSELDKCQRHARYIQASKRIKDLEDGIRNLYEADTRTSYTPTADRISACEQLYKLIGIEV